MLGKICGLTIIIGLIIDFILLIFMSIFKHHIRVAEALGIIIVGIGALITLAFVIGLFVVKPL